MITITKRPDSYWLIVDASEIGADIPYDAWIEQQLAELMTSDIPGLTDILNCINCPTRKLAIALLALSVYGGLELRYSVIQDEPLLEYDPYIGFTWNLANPDNYPLLEALTNLLEPQTIPRKIPYGQDLGPHLRTALFATKV